MKEKLDNFQSIEKDIDSLSSQEPKDVNIQLSEEIKSQTKRYEEDIKPLPLPPMQNINQFIMNCVKNDEYCYSFIDYLKKFYHFEQIDYYFAYMNIIYCFTPINLVEISKTRKHLKNKYSRDDPGFLLILIINLFVSSVCLNIATSNNFSILKIFNIFFIQTFIMIFLVGLLIALMTKYFFDKYLNCSTTQKLEFTHAFDIHTNSFVVMYVFAVILPYIFLPICSRDEHFIQIFISNIFVFYGILYYFYVSYVEYFSLPFVRKSEKIHTIFWIIVGMFLIFNLFKINTFKLFLLNVVI